MERKDKQKKRIKIGIVVFLCFGVLITLLTLIDFDALYSKLSGPIEVPAPSYTAEDFYPADYNNNILEDPEYLEVYEDCIIWSENGVTERLYGNEYTKYNVLGVLVHDYFAAMISGDEDAYNGLFAKEYLDEYGVLENFPMQRVYEMKAEVLSENTDDFGGSEVVIKLNYKIQKNDGSVRDDMLSDSSVPIDLKVYVNSAGNASIESITNYYGGDPLEGPDMPVVLAVVLIGIPVILIGGFVFTTVWILKRRKQKEA